MALVQSCKINEIKGESPQVAVEVMIRGVECKVAKNGNEYLEIDIMDNTGNLKVRCFDIKKVLIENWETICFKGALSKVLLEVKLFNGSIAPNVIGFRALTDKEIEKNGGNQGFIYSVEEDTKELYKELTSFINRTGRYKKVVKTIVENYKDDFVIAPASKIMHHNCFGGVLYHTVSMLRTATAMGKTYPLDMELLYAGTILHDIMKIKEIEFDEYGSPDSVYKEQGFLIGHIGLIGIELAKTFEKLRSLKLYKLTEEDEFLLYHMVFAHHGKLEWGSPIRPCIPESIILSFIDDVDAKLWSAFNTLNKTESGTLSPTVRVFGHGLYKKRDVIESEQDTEALTDMEEDIESNVNK